MENNSLEDCLKVLLAAGFQPEISRPDYHWPMPIEKFKAGKENTAYGHDVYLTPVDVERFERLNFGFNINHVRDHGLKLTIMKGSKIGAMIRIDRGDVSKDGKYYQFTLISDIGASKAEGIIDPPVIESYLYSSENRSLKKLS